MYIIQHFFVFTAFRCLLVSLGFALTRANFTEKRQAGGPATGSSEDTNGGSSQDLDMWLITMASKSLKDRAVPFPNGRFMAYKWWLFPFQMAEQHGGTINGRKTPFLIGRYIDSNGGFSIAIWLY